MTTGTRNGQIFINPFAKNTNTCKVFSKNDAVLHYTRISESSNRFVSTNNNTNSCSQEVTIANAEPVVQSIPNYIILKNTPFLLQAAAKDANSDGLTYIW
jgi:hypothetical protein